MSHEVVKTYRSAPWAVCSCGQSFPDAPTYDKARLLHVRHALEHRDKNEHEESPF